MTAAAATIGIDFDNTIVGYDELMYRIALDRGLIDGNGDRTKRAVRDRVRQLADGEIEWQKLQALAYGPLIGEARLLDGADEFIRRCRDAGMAVVIVSHKTEYASFDETRTNLRTAAIAWMAAHRFFDRDGLGLGRDAVFFESTRADKIGRIRAVGCSHFIDDLEEVFLEASFPREVQKILYAPDAALVPASSATVVPSWRALCDVFFDRRA
jgi:phosphoserine phosphatase